MKRTFGQLEPSETFLDEKTFKTTEDSNIGDAEIENHPDYKYELNLILKMQKRRLLEAERNRDRQIDNIRALYDFEIENINAAMKLSCEEVKEQVRESIAEDRDEKAVRHAEEEAKKAQEKKMLAMPPLPLPPDHVTIHQNNIDEIYDRRRTRSLSLASENGHSAAGFEEAIADLKKKATKPLVPQKKAPVAGMPSVLSRRANGSKKSKIFSEEILQNALSEEEVRQDFLQIVHHLEDSAVAMTNSEDNIRPTVSAVVKEDTLTISLPPLSNSIKNTMARPSKSQSRKDANTNTVQFRTGSMVVVRNTTSTEDLSGTVTVISAEKDDFVVRMYTGPRLRVPLSQVRSGRITVARDVEAYRDMALIMAARGQYADT